ncbi:MAG: hypothetical protein RBR02_09620 [Desulfuromonadaceae bacterium]|nr:hypothetical protein [Desulfuromonadaceae bacterium]
MKMKKMLVAFGGVVVLLLLFFISVEGDYREHQRPLKISDLSAEKLTEFKEVQYLIERIERADAFEDKEIYLAFKTTGEVKKKSKLMMFDPEYQSLLKRREAIFNPFNRKTEGFGYVVYKFLGVVK